jgi:hypothetical protein
VRYIIKLVKQKEIENPLLVQFGTALVKLEALVDDAVARWKLSSVSKQVDHELWRVSRKFLTLRKHIIAKIAGKRLKKRKRTGNPNATVQDSIDKTFVPYICLCYKWKVNQALSQTQLI